MPSLTFTGASPGAPSAEALAERLVAQRVLFSRSPRRGELRALGAPRWPTTPVRIRVHRNHAVEPALSVATPYLRYAGLEPAWQIGDYDDSLSLELAGEADVEVVWLDYARLAERLAPGEIAAWLGGRLAALGTRSDAPVIVLDWDGEPGAGAEFTSALAAACAPLAGVNLADRAELFATLGDGFFDLGRAPARG